LQRRTSRVENLGLRSDIAIFDLLAMMVFSYQFSVIRYQLSVISLCQPSKTDN
jgi:hypothetical protein